MKFPSRKHLIAGTVAAVLLTVIAAVPAAASNLTYQRVCAYTSFGIRCWYQPTVNTGFRLFGAGTGTTTVTVRQQPATPTTTTTPRTTTTTVAPWPTQPAQPTQPTPTTPSTQGLTTQEQQMLNLVNQERSRNRLAPLQADLQLTRLARLKSQDMISKRYFSHQSPTYGSPFDMLKNNGVSYRTAGENIAGNGSVSGAHTALMNSPGHRANILKREFTHVGIGVIDGGQYGKMFTQLFIGR